MENYSSMKKMLIASFLINAVLVSTHKGEFWPFSIFPMFSQAGNPWSRGIVTNVSDPGKTDLWQVKSLDVASAKAVPLIEYGVNEIGYANFVSKTKLWDKERIQALRDLLQFDRYQHKTWMIKRVTGHLTRDDSVVVEAIPMFMLTGDSTYKNPYLFNN
jgi:hypothetical protein